MPGMDGIQLTRQVKTQIETSHIPIILLTARTALIFKMDGLESGADDYITKPFNFNLLQLRIRNLIASRKNLRERYAKDFQRFDNAPNEVSYPDLDQQFLAKVTEIVEEHIANSEFSVDDLARKLLMNRKQVYRKIKALTDSTPVDFIRAIRLKQAAILLRSRQYTISEVTYMVGFQDLKYFRERFKAFFGVNPSDIE
jgi:DNA-binding response OmpR family regulator